MFREAFEPVPRPEFVKEAVTLSATNWLLEKTSDLVSMKTKQSKD